MEPPAHRAQGVRLRVGIATQDNARLMDAFAPPPSRSFRRDLWLLEALPGTTSLAEQGVFVMIRKSETEPPEVSVQICPARRSLTERLSASKPETGEQLQIEEEDDGVDRTDVATLTCHGRDSLTSHQLVLLTQALGVRGNAPRLRRLDRLSESAWSARQVGVDFTVRKWAGLSFDPRPSMGACEVSARADPDEARLVLAGLVSILRNGGVDPDLRPGRLEKRVASALLGRRTT